MLDISIVAMSILCVEVAMKEINRFGIDIKKEKKECAVIYGVACIYSLLEKEISKCLRPFKLSPVKFNALMTIKHQGKNTGISQVEISKKLIVTASNMSRLLERMEKEGLVERISREGDKRINLIKISSKGSDLLDKAWPVYSNKLSELGMLINKSELQTLSAILLDWFTKLDNI
ncbi:MarR family winged helix-turn-helix transcriptional regulator [Chlamydiota bacterium]